MKISSVALVSVLFAVWSLAPVHAGVRSVPPIPLSADASASAAASSGGLIDPISGAVSVGYDSKYIFRGADLGKNSIWGQLEFEFPLGDYDLGFGTWYQNPVDGSHLNPAGEDELDLFVNLYRDFGDLSAWLGYTAYLFPEAGGGDTHEVGVGVGTPVGPLDLGLAAYYDFELANGTWYFEVTAGHSIGLTDRITFALIAGIGYEVADDLDVSDFTHVDLIAALPIEISDSTTLEPYIAGVLPLDGRDAVQDDALYGGITLSVTF